MKKTYNEPTLEAIFIEKSDIITTSPGTETGIIDENDGCWDLDLNP